MRWLQDKGRLLWEAVRELGVDGELQRQAVAASVQRVFWTAPVLVLANFLAAFTFWLRSAPTTGRELLWRNLIITANLGVSVLTMLIWLISKKLKGSNTSTRVQALFVYFVVAYVLAAGSAISLVDQLVMASITPFLLCVTIVGTFYYLHPCWSLFLFAAAYVAFNLALGAVGGSYLNLIQVQSNQVNALVVTGLGYALSLLSWLHFRREVLQQRIIAGQQEQLRNWAYQDPLTGLPNRRYLDERIKEELNRVRGRDIPVVLLMCDIDRFKQVNDTYGHLAGDNLLRELACLLQRYTRGDSILVRLGGEEFVILVPGANLREGTLLAERLRQLVEEHRFTLGGREVRITLSIGVADLTGSEDGRAYYSRADRALYQAKELGRNRVVAARQAGGEKKQAGSAALPRNLLRATLLLGKASPAYCPAPCRPWSAGPQLQDPGLGPKVSGRRWPQPFSAAAGGKALRKRPCPASYLDQRLPLVLLPAWRITGSCRIAWSGT